MIDSKLLIIGNGSSTKDFELGQKIDSEFDIIVRFNRGYFEGIENYEKYIGSKTNILIIHDGFAKPEYITNDVLNSIDCIMVVNDMNRYHFLPKKIQNDFFINILRPKKRFSPWLRKDTIKDLDLVKRYYGYSNEKAQQALKILTKDQLNFIKSKFETGGRQ